MNNGGTLTIEDGVIINAVDKNGGGCIKNKGGKVIINGGTFTSKTDLYIVVNLSGDITINNGSFNGVYGCVDCQGGNITINDGTFNNDGTGSGQYHLYTAGSGAITYTDAAIFTGKPFSKLGNNIEKK